MSEMNIEQARFNMIEQQIRPWEVLDQKVLNLIADVPREEFVPAPYMNLAFADMNVPIGYNEVMMSPKLEARMLQALAIQPHEAVLEVGTGTGRPNWPVTAPSMSPSSKAMRHRDGTDTVLMM